MIWYDEIEMMERLLYGLTCRHLFSLAWIYTDNSHFCLTRDNLFSLVRIYIYTLVLSLFLGVFRYIRFFWFFG